MFKTSVSRIFLLSITFLANQACLAGTKSTQAIYGNDDRKDVYEVRNKKTLKIAGATVAFFKNNKFTQNEDLTLTLKPRSLLQVDKVCAKEPFSGQQANAFCSGTLIGKNLILTAGHCIADDEVCADTKIVFGYEMHSARQSEHVFTPQNIYQCKSVLYREDSENGKDLAVIELDRKVQGHQPVKIEKWANRGITEGASLLLIGHPQGLPTKIDEGGVVTSAKETGYFVASTDSYSGSSGSGVFDPKSGRLIGVLVSGEPDDYVMDSTLQCNLSKHCKISDCKGEDVSQPQSILEWLKIHSS